MTLHVATFESVPAATAHTMVRQVAALSGAPIAVGLAASALRASSDGACHWSLSLVVELVGGPV